MHYLPDELWMRMSRAQVLLYHAAVM